MKQVKFKEMTIRQIAEIYDVPYMILQRRITSFQCQLMSLHVVYNLVKNFLSDKISRSLQLFFIKL